ncbi:MULTISPECIES: ORC-CDC6 family AAA ATPase [unclassified Chitinophaga]|uniref:ORC-CDC6 family AAA ATPase n=1 Tax=unclassified Chitinophaga TaxID=2619133 RepID=UPI00301030A9
MKLNSAYDSANAKYLDFEEVADSFIRNHYFDSLIKNSHSILMGPRGCGKTTLLKMLTIPALRYWDEKNKSKLIDEIPFISIYVPSDILWKKQLDQLNIDFTDSEFTSFISRSTVTINILLSVIKTFNYLSDYLIGKGVISAEEKYVKENSISKQIIDLWILKKPILPTFDAIEIDLLNKVAILNLQIRKKRLMPSYVLELEDFFYLDYLDLVRQACLLFEKNYWNDNSIRRWALCFDELEIAPEWLQSELLGLLRSTDQRLIFKLTTAPIISLYKELKNGQEVTNASEGHDFNVIKIWTSNQKEFKAWKGFSEQLVKSRIKRKSNSVKNIKNIVGDSDLERILESNFSLGNSLLTKNDFENGTNTWMLFKELGGIDQSFKLFLHRRKVDPVNPVPKNTKQKDEIFRKAKQLAIYRYQFLKSGGKKRSRKLVPLYYGIPLIYELADGNPRLLISIVDEMLSASELRPGEFRSLEIQEQTRIIIDISERQFMLFSSHPDANVYIKDRTINLSDILAAIGSYFQNKMLVEDFSVDPIGSFKVDSDINNKYVELLELALYMGAIVYLDNSDVISKQGILNKRFRLGYILNPYFNLLCREYKETNLSAIIGKPGNLINQITLFSDEY